MQMQILKFAKGKTFREFSLLTLKFYLFYTLTSSYSAVPNENFANKTHCQLCDALLQKIDRKLCICRNRWTASKIMKRVYKQIHKR